MTLPESLARRVDKLNSIITDAQDELNRLRTVYSRFPNLHAQHDKWNYARYFTSEANSIANDVDIQYTCGVIVARPLIVVNGFNIYSDPIDFLIGEDSSSYHAYNFYDNWEAQLIAKNINQVAIEKIRQYVIKFTAIDEDSEHDYTNQGNE